MRLFAQYASFSKSSAVKRGELVIMFSPELATLLIARPRPPMEISGPWLRSVSGSWPSVTHRSPTQVRHRAELDQLRG